MNRAIKKPIYRDELMPFIQQGIFMSIVLGLLLGAINLLLEEVVSLSLSLIFNIIIVYYLARRLRPIYQEPHIWYSILMIVFYVFTFYLMTTISLIGFFFIRNFDVFEINAILTLLNPKITFYFLNVFSRNFFHLNIILEFIFFIVGAGYAYTRSK